MLEKVITGKVQKPHLILIFGPDGIGKSTFAADAPSPIFIGKEDGTANLDVARFPEPMEFEHVKTCISELSTKKHPYKTLAIDSLDWIEPLVWKHVCDKNGWKNIEEPGYGKGYALANSTWIEMISALSDLRAKTKMNIIAIAHSHVKVFNDPSLPAPYDRYQLKLNDKAAALWREFVDFVGFANYEIFLKTEKGTKAKAFGDGKRVLYTERRPSFDAKNRLGLPFELPLGFEAYAEAAKRGEPDSISEIKNDITTLSQSLPEDRKKKLSEHLLKIGDNVIQLEKTRNQLRGETNGEERKRMQRM